MARPSLITDELYDAIMFDREMLDAAKYRTRARGRITHPLVTMLLTRQARLWRVEFKRKDRVRLIHIGLPDQPAESPRTEHPDNLPEWMKHRIAALDIFGEDFPTDYVDGVGRRLNKEVYYVEE